MWRGPGPRVACSWRLEMKTVNVAARTRPQNLSVRGGPHARRTTAARRHARRQSRERRRVVQLRHSRAHRAAEGGLRPAESRKAEL
jgi:hypothetical protein